jgi:hypothetical protein
MFTNRRALRDGRLEVHGWAERFGAGVRKRFDLMGREDWRSRFERFAEQLAGSAIYVTVDLDCLRVEEAATNWENGLFTAAEVAWAVKRLRGTCKVVGGDLCGAYSPPRLERWTQRLASGWDHPKIEPIAIEEARRRNLAALETIWPALTT